MINHNGCIGCNFASYPAGSEPCNKCKTALSCNDPNYATAHDFYKDKDVISHPAHYCYSKYEPKDVIRAWGLNFNLGNAIKYIARAGRKDDILQELNKAKQYIDFEIEAIEEERKATDSGYQE